MPLPPPDALIWVIEDDQALGTLLQEELEDAGFAVSLKASAEIATRDLRQQQPDLIVSDLRLPDMDGLTFLKTVRDTWPHAPPGFLLITAFGTIPKAVEALKAGADDFLTKPLDLEHFILCVQRILEQKRLREMVTQMRGLLAENNFHGIYGTSSAIRRLCSQIQQISQAQGPVLITGESGTGKELVAHAIHKASQRARGPFLPVNCAGIPEHLLESEFFGHTEGSFTGAQKNRQGLFAEAAGGSLLLDEISEMPLVLQAKLLRVLQDGSLRRVGENHEHKVDVRVLAATHRDLEEEVRRGNFREDLFFRLEAFTLRIPPLRHRGEDLEFLALRFLQQFALAQNKRIKGFSERSLELIRQYPFPGNVRELSNAVERAVTFATDAYIQIAHLPNRIRNYAKSSNGSSASVPQLMSEGDPLLSLAELEQQYIQQVMAHTKGNKRQAAAILGIGRRTLYRRLGESGIEKMPSSVNGDLKP